MSIAAKISLAAAFAAVLAVTNAQAAVQGFSIALIAAILAPTPISPRSPKPEL
jgi:hypothetical protein